MKFYRTAVKTDEGCSAGYEFHTSEAAARMFCAKWRGNHPEGTAVTEPIEVAPTKAGILAALNRYAAHADNG
jgi:hypothetical protein